MGFRKILSFSFVFILILSLPSVQGQDEKLRIAYDDAGLLSVALENADLQEVLTALAGKTGISIKSPENLKKSITVQFDRIALEEGLHRILRDIDHVLIFTPSNEEGEAEIVSGVFIPPEQAEGSRSRPTPTPSTVRSTPEREVETTVTTEEGLASERGPDEEEPEDPLIEKYERQLDQLEEQMEMVEEGSPQEKAIMSRITRLRNQIEKRLEELDQEESE